MQKITSLKQAVTVAQSHVTVESRATARLVDGLQDRGASLSDWEFYQRNHYWPEPENLLGDA